jgi:hypothetical protein
MRSRRDFLLILEIASPGFAADQHKAQEFEGLRFTEPALFAVLRRMAAELDQAGLVRVQRQRELPQPFVHRVSKAASVALMLEAHDCVIGVPDHDHVARGLAPSPALGPEIENVVEIDVREQRRNHRALARPFSSIVTIPSSRTPARSHFWTSRMMRLSPTRCFRKRTTHSWETSVKNDRMSASRMKFTYPALSTGRRSRRRCDARSSRFRDARGLPPVPARATGAAHPQRQRSRAARSASGCATGSPPCAR